MSSDERPDSLADLAAAWVPPWDRPPGHQARATTDDAPEPAVDAPEPVYGVPAAAGVADGEAPIGEAGADESSALRRNTTDLGSPAHQVDSDNSAADSCAGPAGAGSVPAAARIDVPSGRPDPSAADAPPTQPLAVRRSPDRVPAQWAGEEPAPQRLAEPAPVATPAAEFPVEAAGDATTGAQPVPPADPAAALDDHELRAALEAILLVVDEPVAEMLLAQVIEQPTERVAAMLERISADYTAAGRGFDLRRAAGGWRLYTRPEYAPYVERFVLDGQSLRLTQAALETLAVIAYKQPVSRSRISAIRGVNCDGVMRTLVSRGLVQECGTEPESGAFLYRTTVLFLEKLGLNSVDQLPPLAPFLPDDVEEVFDAQR